MFKEYWTSKAVHNYHLSYPKHEVSVNHLRLSYNQGSSIAAMSNISYSMIMTIKFNMHICSKEQNRTHMMSNDEGLMWCHKQYDTGYWKQNWNGKKRFRFIINICPDVLIASDFNGKLLSAKYNLQRLIWYTVPKWMDDIYKIYFLKQMSLGVNLLTHWGRVMHICVGKLTIIGSDNGLSPERRRAIIWTNAGILLIGSLGTNFSEISIEIQTFSLKKIRLKMSSAKCCSFRLGLNGLK